MTIVPEIEGMKENSHKQFLYLRNLDLAKKIQFGEITPEEAAREWTNREYDLENKLIETL